MIKFSESEIRVLNNSTVNINTVVAVTRNMCIGFGVNLVVRHKEDMQHFRAATMGLPVVMGRKTFESCHRPLHGRSMCVLTGLAGLSYTDAQVFDTTAELVKHLLGFKDVVVAGGSSVYELFDPVINGMTVTLHDTEIQGDKFFTGGIARDGWVKMNHRDMTEKNAEFTTTLIEYVRTNI